MAQIKRLILCCDGTWNDSISTNNPLTNVARFSGVVEDRAEDGILQIVYYHTGVGAGTSRISNSIDGAVGRGLGANVRNAYNFLCQNFNHKDCNDEIYLVGFSRGAFTVRCVAALVDSIGILTKPGLSRLYDAYGLWKKQSADPKALEDFVAKLEADRLVKTGIKIKACGVWDTRLSHVDNRIPQCVEHAFHAMALDERRSTFWPIPWSERRDHSKLQQCWFLGSHSDVGGGYEDAGLANVALLWMIAQFQHFTSLAFDVTYLLDFLVTKGVEVETREYGISAKAGGFGVGVGYEYMHVKTTSAYKGEAGKISNSFTPLWHAFGQRSRIPGTSYLVNKMQHSIGITGAKDDLGITTSSTPHMELNAGTSLNSDEAEAASESDLADAKNPAQQFTCDRIHFTVRVLLAKQHHSCHVLKHFSTATRGNNLQDVYWQLSDNGPTRKAKSSTKSMPQHVSIDEARVTEEESKLLELWLNAAAARGILSSSSAETRAGFHGVLSLDSKAGRRDERTFPPLLRSASSEQIDERAAEIRKCLDEAEPTTSFDLWVLLYAHFKESVAPTLMYNSDSGVESTL